MNDPNKDAGRVSNLTDEARARGAESTRLKSLVSMEAVTALVVVAACHQDDVWRGLSLRAKADVLSGRHKAPQVYTAWGAFEWSAVQVSRLEEKGRRLLHLVDAGELDRERAYELSNAPSEYIDALFEKLEYLREAVEKQSE